MNFVDKDGITKVYIPVHPWVSSYMQTSADYFSMESSHLVKFSTSGKFIRKFNVLRCISLSETLFSTGARGRIPITLKE